MVGKTLGHYEIIEPLGKGGMGEVYRARDTKLDRDVAIKVLPEELSADPDRLARLEREAHLLAALNHSNIATIHALEEDESTRFLVLELVKGESLEQRLSRGALPVDKALEVCKQIAEALEAAHGEGIIHRDLKPANILITPAGQVKVLDFGIAKSMTVDVDVAETSHATNLTVAGTLVGTPAYMSPEQIRDEPLDKRADIWAFGCLLYETLTARSAFGRETLADTLAAIVDQDPDWDALSRAGAGHLLPLLRRCLQRDPKHRLRDIGDAWVEIEETIVSAELPDQAQPGRAKTNASEAPVGISWKLVAPITAAAILFGASATWWTMRPIPEPVKRLNISLPVDQKFPPGVGSLVTISPDGQHLVYVAVSAEDGARRLYHRRFDSIETVALSGTEGAAHPFFSSDSRLVGFATQTGHFYTVPLGGGLPQLITSLGQQVAPYAVWREDDTIVWSRGTAGIYVVSANGGDPELLVEVDPEIAADGYERLDLLPGGDAVVAEAVRGAVSNTGIALVSLVTGEQVIIEERGTDPAYLSSGHVVFARPGELWAIPVDPDSLRATGRPEMIQRGVRVERGGAAHFAAASDGTFVYVPGAASTSSLVWVERDGTKSPILEGVFASTPRLSPDGRRIAYENSPVEGGDSDIWIYNVDLATNRRLTSLTGSEILLDWEPAGEGVFFASAGDEGEVGIYRMLGDFSSRDPERMLSTRFTTRAGSVSVDGSVVVLQHDSGSVSRIDRYDLPSEGAPDTVIDSVAEDFSPALSPDGRWLAYVSSESNRDEVLVTSFPERGTITQVSTASGVQPVWSGEGRELFYRSPTGLMAVQVELEPTFRVIETALLVSNLVFGNDFPERWSPQYDYDSKTERFVALSSPTSQSIHFNVILNWFEELKRLVPTGGR